MEDFFYRDMLRIVMKGVHMKHEPIATANALAVTVAFVWAICALGIALLPGPSMMVSRWWMHGLDMGVLGIWRVTFGGFLFGGIPLIVMGWLSGYVFASSYNYFLKKKK